MSERTEKERKIEGFALRLILYAIGLDCALQSLDDPAQGFSSGPPHYWYTRDESFNAALMLLGQERSEVIG